MKTECALAFRSMTKVNLCKSVTLWDRSGCREVCTPDQGMHAGRVDKGSQRDRSGRREGCIPDRGMDAGRLDKSSRAVA